MRIYNIWTRAIAVVALALLVGGSAHAQLQTGNLYGTVVDDQDAALPGVTVTLTGPGAPEVQVTDPKGRFRFLNLGPASYSLKAELEGFSTVVYRNLVINVGRNTRFKVKLNPAVEDIIMMTNSLAQTHGNVPGTHQHNRRGR